MVTDQLVRATARQGYIRAIGVITTQAVATAQARHQLSHVATAALGRVMSAALLLAASFKEPQARLSVQIQGDGELGTIWADAGANGTVRGYVQHPQVELPLDERGKLAVGEAVGRSGYVHVTRDYGEGTPYTSTVELVTGEIGTDMTHYLALSEQTPSVMLVGEFLEWQRVRLAGGILVQLMPGYPEELLTLVEERVNQMPVFTSLLASGEPMDKVLLEILADFEGFLLPPLPTPRFYCPCSAERVLNALKLLGSRELRDMILTDGGVEATCHFCNQVYQVSAAELQQLVLDLEGN
ncbi:MAG: Hsp33 family molecular chaperone HslO [Thermostichales cyanobacterium DRC_bins_46]